MRYQRAEVKTGVFVVLASATFLGLLIYVSGYVDAFLNPEVRFFTLLADAEGLNDGAQVSFAGIPAGRVVTLSYQPGGIPPETLTLYRLQTEIDDLSSDAGGNLFLETGPGERRRYVMVVFTLQQQYLGALKSGARAEVQQAIFGGPTLNVHPGPLGATQLEQGAYITGEPSTMAEVIAELGDLRDRFSQIGDQVQEVLGNVARLTQRESALDETFDNLRTVSENVIQLTGTLEDRLDSLLSKELIENVEASSASLRSLLEEVDLAAREHLSDTMANLEDLSADLKDLIGRNQQTVDNLLSTATTTLEDLRGVSTRVNRFLDSVEATITDDEGGLLALSGDLRGVVQNADGLVDDIRRRVAEFKWSYLHYLLFEPDAATQAAGQTVDIARELVHSQERMAASLERVERLLAQPAALDPAMRQDLEVQRTELRAAIERANEIQRLLFERVRAGER